MLVGRAPTSPTIPAVSQAPQLSPTLSVDEPTSPAVPPTVDPAANNLGSSPGDAGSPVPSASERSLVADPEYHPVTLKEYLHTRYEGGLTDLQSDGFEASLRGKRIVWEGTALNVAPGQDGGVKMQLTRDHEVREKLTYEGALILSSIPSTDLFC